jgi:peptidoglycan/xylan/chitin deacetylase (PgdA/CDA1 family)
LGVCGLFYAFSAVVVWGSFAIELGYFVNSITHKRTKIKEVALTFDDGPTEFTPKFLDLLQKHQVKATFFCIGKQIEKYPETFQRIIAEGHTIGNHTLSHSNSTGFLSTSKMIAEIENCDEVMKTMGNIKQICTDLLSELPIRILPKAIKKTHKKSIGWNVRSLDTITDNEKKFTKESPKIEKRKHYSPSRHFGKNVSCTGRFISIFGG